VDFLPGILSGVSSLILFCILGGTLMKVLQISSDVKELKEIMQRRGGAAGSVPVAALVQQAYVPAPATAQPMTVAPQVAYAPPPMPGTNPGPISPEDLVRAVHAQGYDAIISDAEILPPRP